MRATRSLRAAAVPLAAGGRFPKARRGWFFIASTILLLLLSCCAAHSPPPHFESSACTTDGVRTEERAARTACVHPRGEGGGQLAWFQRWAHSRARLTASDRGSIDRSLPPSSSLDRLSSFSFVVRRRLTLRRGVRCSETLSVSIAMSIVAMPSGGAPPAAYLVRSRVFTPAAHTG